MAFERRAQCRSGEPCRGDIAGIAAAHRLIRGHGKVEVGREAVIHGAQALKLRFLDLFLLGVDREAKNAALMQRYSHATQDVDIKGITREQ
jgi:hypothetical protein